MHHFIETVTRDGRETQSRVSSVHGHELWEWAAPWISRTILIALLIFGLFSASAAGNRPESWVGYATAGLAIVIFALRLKRDLDGCNDGLFLDIWIVRTEALWLFLPVMVLLGIGGAMVAITVKRGIYHFAGIALFIVCAGLGFVNAARCIGSNTLPEQPSNGGSNIGAHFMTNREP